MAPMEIRIICGDCNYKPAYAIKTLITRISISEFRGRPELSSFSRAYTAYAGEGGCCMLSKIVVYESKHCDFDMGPLKMNIKKKLYSFGSGVTKVFAD